MILPLMGLLMVSIPAAGFFAGVAFLCIRRLRFLAVYAFFVPFSGSYAAIAGFWGGGILLEGLGAPSGIVGLVCLLMLTLVIGMLSSLAACTTIRALRRRRVRLAY